MSGSLSRLRLARWVLLLLAIGAMTGCAVVRLARWPLLVFAIAASVGCGTFQTSDEFGEDSEDDQVSGYHRGGGVTPGHLNARPGYLNG